MMHRISLRISNFTARIKTYARYGKFNFILVLFSYFFLIGITYIDLTPLFKLVTLSLSNYKDLAEGSTVFLPKDPTFMNFINVFKRSNFFASLSYTALFTVLSTACQIVITGLTGYGLAKYNFRGSKLVFGCVILSIIVPIQTAQIPMYLQYSNFDFFGIGKIIGLFTGETVEVNLLNTVWTYVLPAAFGMGLWSGLYIFLFRQMFKSIPTALMEAARVDGCGNFSIFLRIMVPNAIPAYVTVMLLSFINYWNDSVVGSMFNAAVKVQPLMVYVSTRYYSLTGEDEYYQKVFNCAILPLSVIPLLLLFIVGQKFFIENMDRSGVKG